MRICLPAMDPFHAQQLWHGWPACVFFLAISAERQ